MAKAQAYKQLGETQAAKSLVHSAARQRQFGLEPSGWIQITGALHIHPERRSAPTNSIDRRCAGRAARPGVSNR